LCEIALGLSFAAMRTIASTTIVATATAVPAHSARQPEVTRALRALFPLNGRRMDAVMALFENAQIDNRYSVYPVEQIGVRKSLTETTQDYRRHATALAREVAARALTEARVAASDIDLIITTSCTGVMIPSVDAYLVDALGFRRDVRRLPITELGCVGGASALARAHDFLRGYPDARVLVIAVELPSLSLQRNDTTPANLVASALFGDGAAAAVLSGGGDRPGVRVLETLSHIFPSSTGALGFDLHEDGFHSVISKDIPALLKSEIAALVERLAARAGLTRDQLTCFVLHPGGKKILGAVEDELGLPRDATQPSWDVLRAYGNQSSASVLFVLHEWLTRRMPAAGSHGVLAAFGPGLTTEMLLLQWS
jgi:alkylresorcinol/alkylpyrone synthase